MKKFILFAALFLSAMPAQAISRYDSTAMSCGEVQATIHADGAAIMRYQSTLNPSLPLFGRYVRSDLYCEFDEWANTVYIPASDARHCAVYECEKRDFNDDEILKQKGRRNK